MLARNISCSGLKTGISGSGFAFCEKERQKEEIRAWGQLPVTSVSDGKCGVETWSRPRCANELLQQQQHASPTLRATGIR